MNQPFEFEEQNSLWEPINREIFLSELETASFHNINSMNESIWNEITIHIDSGKLDDKDGPYLRKYSLVELVNRYGRTYRWINITSIVPFGKGGEYVAKAYLVRGTNKSPIVYHEIERYVPFFDKEGKFLGKLIVEE